MLLGRLRKLSVSKCVDRTIDVILILAYSFVAWKVFWEWMEGRV